jgi:hypothetical protein
MQQGGAFRYHELDRLHESLELHDIGIRIQIMDHSIVGHLGVGCLQSLIGGISDGAVVQRIPSWGNHKDQATLPGEVPVVLMPISG